MTEADKIKELIDKSMMIGELSNDDLLEIIKQAGSYLNIQKVSDYAKENGITVQGVYSEREIVKLWGFKFVVDND